MSGVTSKGWLTPPSLPTATVMVAVFIPADVAWWYPLAGALMDLCYASNWEQIDGITPAEAADAYNTMWRRFSNGENMQIGTILPFAGSTLPTGWLACDGSQVLQADYPLLYDVIGSTYGSADSGYFRLPDLQNRFVTGAGDNYDLGDTGGEDTHTLTTGEMPSHTHSYGGVIPTAGGEIPATAAAVNPLPDYTGSAGSGNAHENRPPYLALNWAIVGDWP